MVIGAEEYIGVDDFYEGASSDVRSPTRTSTEVRSPTRTATEVRSPTSTSTEADTQGNFTSTVTGGAGAGATTVNIFATVPPYLPNPRGRGQQMKTTAMDVDTSVPTSDLVSGDLKEKKMTLQPVASGLNLKTCIYREGNYLHAITTMVKDGNPEIFKASVDLTPILAAVARHHRKLHGDGATKVAGFFDSVSALASKIGHSSVVKAVADSVKHATGGGAIHSPVIFPAVSMNAATAYVTAKAAIVTLDEAKQVEAHVKRIVATGSAKAKAVAQSKVPQIKALMAKKALVQKSLASLAQRAKMGDRDALNAQKVFAIVLKSHLALGRRVANKKVQRGMPGLMLTHTGRIVPGHYIANAAKKKLGQQAVWDGKRLQRGPYEAA